MQGCHGYEFCFPVLRTWSGTEEALKVCQLLPSASQAQAELTENIAHCIYFAVLLQKI